MQPQILEARPPYFEFDTRAVEKRTAEGSLYYETQEVILITPHGSKDRIERIWPEYEVYLKKLVRDQMFPPSWLTHYQRAYEEWKAGRDIPVEGTPIRNWPVLSTAQVKILTAAKVRTVEELATANEAVLAQIGMGARGLKQQAVDWVTTKSGEGKVIEQLAALRVQNEALEARLANERERTTALTAQVSALARPQPAGHAPVDPSLFVPGARGRVDDGERQLDKDLDAGLDDAVGDLATRQTEDELT